MRNQKYTKITIDGVSYSEYLRLPLTVQQTLNEQLDSAVVDLFNVPFAEPLKPFSRVVVGGMPYLLAEDSVTENFGRGLYKHSLTLIEETKEAERIICGAKAFTWAMRHSYMGSSISPSVTQYERDLSTSATKWVKSKDAYYMRTSAGVGHLEVVGGTIRIPSAGMLYSADDTADDTKTYAKARIVVGFHKARSAIEIKSDKTGFALAPGASDKKIYTTFDVNEASSIIAEEQGVYTVSYELYVLNASKEAVPYITWIYDVRTAVEAVEKPKATIKEVVEKLLDTCETIRKGDTPRYSLLYTAEQEGIMNTIAPEFHFANGRSLWENLREIGKYIHAIPRITGDELTFDQLGSTEYADLSKGQRVAQTSSLNISDYTAGLDTMANNLVNMDDEADGSITEPFDKGYVTMRAMEDEARIQEGTGILLTTYPVEKLLKLELGAFAVDGKTYPGANLTPFVFEKSEYDLLSNFTGSFPDSKTYALYYTQGGKNITGFWYKANDTPTDIGNTLLEYSITNIIEAATAVNAGFFKNLPYTDLKFRITYIPSVTARVRQYKPDYDGRFPSVMVHNQSANKLSASALGQNLRGQLGRYR